MGTTVRARDGEVGTVQDLYFDNQQWRVKYLAVKTAAETPNDVVLVAPSAVHAPWNTAEVPIDLTREEVNRSAPDVLPSDRHLMSSAGLNGCHIQATDGEIGHIDDVLVDEDSWNIRYVVLDTSNWIGGRSVLISREVVDAIDSPNRKIRVRLTRDEIKRGPSVDTADIETIETLPAVWIM